MGIETVAEYVQDKETYDILVMKGIDYLQGYYIDRPSPVSEKMLGSDNILMKNKANKGSS